MGLGYPRDRVAGFGRGQLLPRLLGFGGDGEAGSGGGGGGLRQHVVEGSCC